jgi:hypothetical protein
LKWDEKQGVFESPHLLTGTLMKITYKKDSDSSKIFSPQKQQPKSLPQ